MNIIDGKRFAEALYADLKYRMCVAGFSKDDAPGLSVLLVGDDPASQVYVKNKKRQAEALGFRSEVRVFPASTTEYELLESIKQLNFAPSVHGILVQLPLPETINEKKILRAIDPRKDVDGFHEVNAGRLMIGDSRGLLPCTPMGCMRLISEVLDGKLEGANAVVIGCSNIVGKPMALLLLREKCTVTLAHDKTRDLAAITRQADIVVVAVGVPGLVKADWIKPGAIVIDVGINRAIRHGKPVLVGDVDFENVAPIAGAITPVPGGVGPMTIACLLENTLVAAESYR